MPDDELRRQFTRALLIVWLIVGFVSGVAVGAPLVASSNTLYQLFPTCAAKAAGSSCMLCGMTTAFVQISGGDFHGARISNAGSIELYSILGLNFVASLAYTIWRVIRHANS